jgi:hypothetical protein
MRDGDEIDPKLLLIAAHELGHALAWTALGLKVKSIRVNNRLFGTSEVLLDPGMTWTPETGRHWMVGLLAGPEAGQMWAEATRQRYNERHDAGDMDSFRAYRRQAAWARQIPERVLRNEARAIVRQKWSQLERLVDTLASQGKLRPGDLR